MQRKLEAGFPNFNSKALFKTKSPAECTFKLTCIFKIVLVNSFKILRIFIKIYN